MLHGLAELSQGATAFPFVLGSVLSFGSGCGTA